MFDPTRVGCRSNVCSPRTEWVSGGVRGRMRSGASWAGYRSGVGVRIDPTPPHGPLTVNQTLVRMCRRMNRTLCSQRDILWTIRPESDISGKHPEMPPAGCEGHFGRFGSRSAVRGGYSPSGDASPSGALSDSTCFQASKRFCSVLTRFAGIAQRPPFPGAMSAMPEASDRRNLRAFFGLVPNSAAISFGVRVLAICPIHPLSSEIRIRCDAVAVDHAWIIARTPIDCKEM